ncbi:MAG: G1 family glutamic endopeptidase [Actinomycetota bacterium]
MKRALSILAGLVVVAGAPAAAHAATPKPSVVGLTASVKHLDSGGGDVAVRARVKAARTCLFTLTRGSTVAVRRTVSCSSGAATVTLTSAPNRQKTPLTLHFSVRATSKTGAASKTLVIVQDGVPPLTVVAPGQLSSGIQNSAYSTTLLADGGIEPYTWSLTSGTLPPGLTLNADGTITGTPTAAAQAAFTATVTDALGDTASADFTLTVTNPTTTAERSSNWSGYIDRGGPFTSVTGTFTVPTVTADAGTDNSQWVGIDGDSNQDLIQAGVAETVSGFSGRVTVYAWWEILPAAETPVTLPVAMGDQVTVTITQTGAGTWTIKIADLTNGKSFTTTQSYSGELTSAEWVLEAPTSGRGQQTSLAAFSPPVTFTGLGITGTVNEIVSVQMVQRGVAVATPSTIDANGFTVAYGSAAPPAP